MGFASVFGITGSKEWVFWIIIWLVFAVIIAKNVKTKLLGHGIMIGILAAFTGGIVKAFLYSTYLVNNPDFAEKAKTVPASLSGEAIMIFTSPVVGLLTGFVLGVFAIIASKILAKFVKNKQ